MSLALGLFWVLVVVLGILAGFALGESRSIRAHQAALRTGSPCAVCARAPEPEWVNA